MDVLQDSFVQALYSLKYAVSSKVSVPCVMTRPSTCEPSLHRISLASLAIRNTMVAFTAAHPESARDQRHRFARSQRTVLTADIADLATDDIGGAQQFGDGLEA